MSNSVLGVILQGATFFCAYAGTEPEYIPLNHLITYKSPTNCDVMRDTIGSRPYEIKKDGSKYVISFYPQAKNAKNPDAVLFKLTLTKDDLKKLEKTVA